MSQNQITATILSCVILSSLVTSLPAKARNPKPSQRSIKTTLPVGEPVPISATQTDLPLYVYGNESGEADGFSASGFMGDSDSLKTLTSKYDASAPVSTGRTSKTSLKVRYLPKGREGWAGIYWLKPANNWGRIKGAGYDLRKSDRLTFWIRGKNGGEKISQVKVGGINGPYPDSDVATLGPLKLSKEWEQYTIPLKDKDLSHIVGGFAIIFRRQDNPKGATVFLDGIIYEEKDTSLSKHVKLEKSDVVQGSTSAVVSSEPVVMEKAEPVLRQPIERVILFSNANKGFDDNAKEILNEIQELATEYKSAKLLFVGHTDDIGPAEVNLRLSKERAQAVADYFKETGLEEGRFSVTGVGEEKPISSNKTKEGRQKNRRVEIVLQPSQGANAQ